MNAAQAAPSADGAAGAPASDDARETSDGLAGGPLDFTAQRYDVHTGAEISGGATNAGAETIQAGGGHVEQVQIRLQPPRYCGLCARRMVVQVRPDGWWAKCSRHGRVDSTALDQR